MKKILLFILMTISIKLFCQTYSVSEIYQQNDSENWDTISINMAIVIDTLDKTIILETEETEPVYYSWFNIIKKTKTTCKYLLLDINDVEGTIIFKKDEIIIDIDEIKYKYNIKDKIILK